MNIPEYKLVVDVTNQSSSYGNSRVYRFKLKDDTTMLRIKQTPFPECCGVALLSNYSCDPELGVEGFNKCLSMLLHDLTLNDRFSKVLIFNNADNRLTRLFMSHPKAIVGETFRNRRTDNMLISVEYSLELPEELKSHNFASLDSEDPRQGVYWSSDEDLESPLDSVSVEEVEEFERLATEHAEQHQNTIVSRGDQIGQIKSTSRFNYKAYSSDELYQVLEDIYNGK